MLAMYSTDFWWAHFAISLWYSSDDLYMSTYLHPIIEELNEVQWKDMAASIATTEVWPVMQITYTVLA